MNSNPIGVFDSGIGGLTVVKEIIRELPNETLFIWVTLPECLMEPGVKK